MGLVIVTGLTIGTLFSLHVVPVIYTYMATAKAKLVKLPEARAGIASPGSEEVSH